MTDVHQKTTRSRNMAAIRSSDTKPEIWVRKRLHAAGFRFRLNVSGMPGRPDIVLRKYRAVIFVNGCFWHKHECALFKWPKSRQEWWRQKLNANHQRDLVVQDKLRECGWRVLTIWECALKGPQKWPEDELVQAIINWPNSGGPLEEIGSDYSSGS